MVHAIEHWRRQFRGEALPKERHRGDRRRHRRHNLILWGDPCSNSILAKIAGKLPLTWTADKIHRLQARLTTPITTASPWIFPNPLNPKKYVVLNSGFTFREFDYLNNARQIPKLGDYAVLDVAIPADGRRPAGIVVSGFFDERWQVSK